MSYLCLLRLFIFQRLIRNGITTILQIFKNHFLNERKAFEIIMLPKPGQNLNKINSYKPIKPSILSKGTETHIIRKKAYLIISSDSEINTALYNRLVKQVSKDLEKKTARGLS